MASSASDSPAAQSAADLADERDTATIHAALASHDTATLQHLDLRTLLKASPDKLKKACRVGIPFSQRREVWKALFELNTPKVSVNYHAAKLEIFNGIARPTHFPRIPDFGSTMKWNENFIHLTPMRINQAKAILCVLACSHASLTHCPFLPDLTCVLLIFFEEAVVYELLERMLARSKQDEFYFTTNGASFLKWMRTFGILLEQKNGDLHRHLAHTLKLDPGKLFQVWLSRLFIQYLPLRTVFRILDTFLFEGNKILFRVSLALLKLHTKELLQCATSRALLVKLHDCITRQTPDQLLDTAFDIYLSRTSHMEKIVEHLHENEKRLLVNPPNARRAHFHLPRFTHQHDHVSEFITLHELYTLWSWLPAPAAICDPVLMYSSSLHGYSYDTLWKRACERTVGSTTPVFLLLHDATTDHVLGLFLNRPLPDHPEYRNRASRAAHRVGGLTGSNASTSPLPLDPHAFLFVLRPFVAAYKHRVLKEDEQAKATEHAAKQDLVPPSGTPAAAEDPASSASSPQAKYVAETSEEARSFKPYGLSQLLQTEAEHEVMPRKPAGLTITIQKATPRHPPTHDQHKAHAHAAAATPHVAPHHLMPQGSEVGLSSMSLRVGPSQGAATSQPLSELFGGLELASPPPHTPHTAASSSAHAASLQHALALANSPQADRVVPAGEVPSATLSLPPAALPSAVAPVDVMSAAQSALSSVETADADADADAEERKADAMLLMTDEGFGIVETDGVVLFLAGDLKTAVSGPSQLFDSPCLVQPPAQTTAASAAAAAAAPALASRRKMTITSIEVWSFVSPGSDALEALSPRAHAKELAAALKAKEEAEDAQFKAAQQARRL